MCVCMCVYVHVCACVGVFVFVKVCDTFASRLYIHETNKYVWLKNIIISRSTNEWSYIILESLNSVD